MAKQPDPLPSDMPPWARVFMESLREELEAINGATVRFEKKKLTPGGREWWNVRIDRPAEPMWPTPTAAMIQNRSGRYMGGNYTLEGKVRSLVPGEPDNDPAKGSLNHQWCAQLMGLPADWCDLDPAVLAALPKTPLRDPKTRKPRGKS